MNIHFTMYLTIELLQVPHYREKIRVSVSFPCNFIHPKAGSLQVPHPCISPMCLIARSLFMNGQWAWMVVPQWIWKSYNRAPPPHAKKKTDNTQILSSHCQVNFSLCQGSHRAWEHDKEMQRTCFVRPTATGFATDSTLLMREGWSWIRLFFMSTPQQTHVLARQMEPGLKSPLNRKAKGSDSLQAEVTGLKSAGRKSGFSSHPS